MNAWYQDRKSTLIAAGAVFGALAGLLIGRLSAGGALVGGFLGAVAGAVTGARLSYLIFTGAIGKPAGQDEPGLPPVKHYHLPKEMRDGYHEDLLMKRIMEVYHPGQPLDEDEECQDGADEDSGRGGLGKQPLAVVVQDRRWVKRRVTVERRHRKGANFSRGA